MSPQNQIFGKIPFLRFTIAFGIGIAMSVKLNYSAWLIPVCFLFILIIKSKTNLLSNSRTAQLTYSFLVLLLLIFAGSAFSNYHDNNQFKSEITPTKARFTGYVLEKSPSKNNRFKYLVQLNTQLDSTRLLAIDERIVLFNADSLTNKQLQPGKQIMFQTLLNPITNSNNPGEFNYQRYMKLEGVRYQTYLHKEVTILPHEHKTITIKALELQSYLLEKYRKAGIDGDEFAVLAALTLGNKDYLSNDLKSSFSASGAMHVLAVSGLHVGIIYLILKLLFRPLNKVKQLLALKVVLILLSLWLYAFITGLSPSVLRSCTMFSFITIGENIHRKTNIYNMLATSAFCLMVIEPTIIYKVGFQLSYAAVTSIVFFQPKIAALFQPKNKIIKWLWDLFAVSVAAQIGTFPISIYYFHQFPVYFWISNFVAIPAAAILLHLAFFFFAVIPFPFLTRIVGLLINWVVKSLNYSVQYIEDLPFSVIHQLSIDEITLTLMFLFIVTFSWFIAIKKYKPFLLSLIILLFITGYSTYKTIKTHQQTYIVFYNNYSSPLVSLIDGRNHYYYSPSDSINERTKFLLNSSSEFFRTNDAISIKALSTVASNIRLQQQHLFFKKNIITILKRTSVANASTGNIYWFPELSTINVKSNYTISTLNKGKLMKTSLNSENNSFKTQNNSALILQPTP